ncbi:hypothetical protein [uncultured Tessaracoccus sp.]|uniref:hypothetical protein n=1 Tax=uncultured Tessaracoccus sp. TaxID=905023 RepID=UPI002612A9A0|nr:hypothetical protein [uncultured Tessaracoccus sp.]
MKKVLAAAALTMLALTACGGAEEPVQPPLTLTVTATDANGWPLLDGETPEPPEPRIATLRDLQEGDTLTIRILTGDLKVTVKEVSGDDVKLGLSEALAPRVSEGGFDHSDLKRAVRITRGETVDFSTPTMDVSTTCNFTLE